MSVDLIMPTLGKPHALRALESLQYLPFPVRPHFISGGGGWPQAINIGLERSMQDVLLMDDDVQLLPDTFKGFDPLAGDIIGFKLLFPDGRIQHAGGFCYQGQLGHLGYGKSGKEFNEPMWVCHCTASLLYIRRGAVEKLKQMVVWDGAQFEDVDWSFRALKAGFKILYFPGAAIHHESQTKKQAPDFGAKMQRNLRQLIDTHLNSAMEDLLSGYPRTAAARATSAA